MIISESFEIFFYKKIYEDKLVILVLENMSQRSASRAKAWRLRKKTMLPEATTPLKLCYWNCNGLGCVLKQQEIAEVMEEEQIDLMFWMRPTFVSVQIMT